MLSAGNNTVSSSTSGPSYEDKKTNLIEQALAVQKEMLEFNKAKLESEKELVASNDDLRKASEDFGNAGQDKGKADSDYRTADGEFKNLIETSKRKEDEIAALERQLEQKKSERKTLGVRLKNLESQAKFQHKQFHNKITSDHQQAILDAMKDTEELIRKNEEAMTGIMAHLISLSSTGKMGRHIEGFRGSQLRPSPRYEDQGNDYDEQVKNTGNELKDKDEQIADDEKYIKGRPTNRLNEEQANRDTKETEIANLKTKLDNATKHNSAMEQHRDMATKKVRMAQEQGRGIQSAIEEKQHKLREIGAEQQEVELAETKRKEVKADMERAKYNEQVAAQNQAQAAGKRRFIKRPRPEPDVAKGGLDTAAGTTADDPDVAKGGLDTAAGTTADGPDAAKGGTI